MKKNILIVFVIVFSILKCFSQQVPLPDCSYDEGPFYLVFLDDFNFLDDTKWEIKYGHIRNYNKEIQIYLPENVVVEDGKLKLWAKKDSVYGPCYSGEDY
ncbi:MAG: hypothetical protein JW798_08530 [Prolixibacteraceae bacterium]|nr:hypothetical protein [Prolixibacteraceae bacterium]